jgi:phasin family protein
MVQKKSAPSKSKGRKTAGKVVASVVKQKAAVKSPTRQVITPSNPKETTMSKSQSSNSNSPSQFFLLSAEELSQLAKQNSDAFMRSMQTATTGMNQLSQTLAQFSQSMMQMSMAAFQAASSARTLKDVAELQNDYAKTSMDALVENGTKMTEMALKIANDASQPLSQRMNETMQQFNQRTAA